MSSTNQDAHDVFAEWSLYEKIIYFNYMYHREMIAAIQSAVSEIDEPLHVLDLGCGDGWMASQGLASANVASYTGVDLSVAALRSVPTNLAAVTENVSIKETSILNDLRDCDSQSPNLILASYSLHHYQESDQPEIIEFCARRLQPSGGLIWIDLCKHKGETRDEYLQRFWSATLPRWTELNELEMEEVVEHMQSSDYPLAEDERSQAALVGGFGSRQSLYENEFYSADYFEIPRSASSN